MNEHHRNKVLVTGTYFVNECENLVDGVSCICNILHNYHTGSPTKSVKVCSYIL